MPKDTVGDRLTLALKRSGLEDAEVAAKANRVLGGNEHNRIVSASWVSAVKNDRIKGPPIDKLRAVAKVCGVPGSYLTEPLGCIPIEEQGEPPDVGAAIARQRWDEDTKQALLKIIELADAQLLEGSDSEVPERKR